jgi:proline dehydrogenase
MEDSSTVDATFRIATRLRREGLSNVGVVSQAYLRRASNDITAWVTGGRGEVRLCKGIYIEPEEIAFKGKDEVRANFLRLFVQLLDARCFVGIATHDDHLIAATHRILRERSVRPDAYEYQMLLGVREELRNWIREQGHPIRVYVPFASHWYAYSVRRLRENPALAGYVFRAMFLPRNGLTSFDPHPSSHRKESV